VVVEIDHPTAKFNSPPNLNFILQVNPKVRTSAYKHSLYENNGTPLLKVDVS
jgi:hypothetical protein